MSENSESKASTKWNTGDMTQPRIALHQDSGIAPPSEPGKSSASRRKNDC